MNYTYEVCKRTIYIISRSTCHISFSQSDIGTYHIHVHACVHVCYYFCHGQLFTRLYITLYFFNILLDSSFVSTTILICFLDVYLYNNYYVDCFENHYRENIMNASSRSRIYNIATFVNAELYEMTVGKRHRGCSA